MLFMYLCEVAIVSQLCIFPLFLLHGLCEDYLTCDIAFNAVMPLSRASTRGRYSRIEGVISARRHTSSSRVTNPKLDTFEYSAQSATFLISIIVLNLLLNLMKVSYLVMAQTLTLTVSTTISPERLKRR